MEPIAIEELASRIGSESVSDWVEISQEMIDKFADATGDHQFIHVDPVRAADTPMGGTVAHGFLTLSLMPMLAARTSEPPIANVKMGLNYGGNKVRMMAPVRSGKRVRGRFKLLKLAERSPGVWERITEFTVEIEDEAKPALVAEWIALIYV